MFEGILPAIITPFRRDSRASLDIEGLRSNVESLLQGGIHGIVPCGSTGEAATLTFEEHEQVILETVEIVNGKVPVLAGTGSNNTEEAIRHPLSTGCRCRRCSGHQPVLQAKPLRPHQALHETRRSRSSYHPLQRSGPDGTEPPA